MSRLLGGSGREQRDLPGVGSQLQIVTNVNQLPTTPRAGQPAMIRPAGEAWRALTYDPSSGKWTTEHHILIGGPGDRGYLGWNFATAANMQILASTGLKYKAYTDPGLVPEFKLEGSCMSQGALSYVYVIAQHISVGAADLTVIEATPAVPGSAGWLSQSSVVADGAWRGLDSGWQRMRTPPATPKDVLLLSLSIGLATAGTGANFAGRLLSRWSTP